MGVRWEYCRLAARTLHPALDAAGLDPNAQIFLNPYRDGDLRQVGPSASAKPTSAPREADRRESSHHGAFDDQRGGRA